MRAAGVLTTASPQCLKWDRRRRVPALRSPVIATLIVLSIAASRTIGNDVSPEDIAKRILWLQRSRMAGIGFRQFQFQLCRSAIITGGLMWTVGEVCRWWTADNDNWLWEIPM